jgi:8'-apo-carotenoid 13,14-cleaving dioxygenase
MQEHAARRKAVNRDTFFFAVIAASDGEQEMPEHRHSVPERPRRRPLRHLSKLHDCRTRSCNQEIVMTSAFENGVRRAVTRCLLKVAEFNRKRLPVPAQPHNFLTGMHAPMDEELTLEQLVVRGTIPPQLDGRYLRIGPNPIGTPNPAAHHWFNGDGMVHGVRLQGGQARWYRNRWIRSNAVSAALGEAPAPGPRNGRGDTVNTNVLGHAGKVWALVEAGAFPVQLGGELQTVAHDPFGGSLHGSFSAHPHRDPDTGELHAICYSSPVLDAIRHVVVDVQGQVRREEPVAVRHGPSIHDCMLTRHYVLVFDLPVTFSLKTLLAGQPFPYVWNPAHGARVGLLPREGRGSDIVWCDVDPCYVFHACNAFETDDGKVVVDVAVHDTMFAQSVQGPDSNSSRFERWTITPTVRSVQRAVIDDHPQEFPRCDERRLGKPYRYAYAVPLAERGSAFGTENHLIRHDLHRGTRAIHAFGVNRYPGEFVFVARSADAAEDDGWLMGFVIDMATQTTDLVLLDASDFEAPPVAVVTVPHRIPSGFHGNWVGVDKA